MNGGRRTELRPARTDTRPARSDRVAGALLVLLAVATAVEAMTFDVAFPTDPLGPKAFPLLAAGILLAGGVLLIRRPGSEPEWPGRRGWARVVAAGAFLLVYAAVLDVVGFFLGTTILTAALARLLGGPRWRSLAGGAVLAATLYVLFSYLLRLPLPIGSLFLMGG